MKRHVFDGLQTHTEQKAGKGAAAMRVKGRWVLCSCVLFALALLASLSLVDAPVPLREAQELPPPPAAAAFVCESRALPGDSDIAAQVQPQKGPCALLRLPAAFAPAFVPEQDANGCPLRGLRFVRANYQAFPMEDMPG